MMRYRDCRLVRMPLERPEMQMRLTRLLNVLERRQERLWSRATLCNRLAQAPPPEP